MNETELLVQASKSATSYMRAGMAAIDVEFGEGYAAAHPELLAAHMRAAAHDFQTLWLGHKLDALTHALRQALP